MPQVRYFTANGFYVLLDNQFNADDTAKAMPGQWVAWWRQVLQDVIADAASRNQVMLDLLNEPDSQFWKWENAGPAYLQAMDVLHQVGLSHQVFLISVRGLNASVVWLAGCAADAGAICLHTGSWRTRLPVTAQRDAGESLRCWHCRCHADMQQCKLL